MFTDMVGYTALMQSDEADTRARRRRWIDALERHHLAHDGTVVQWMGDGSLSLFSSAASAVRAATSIQQELRAGDPVDVRIGIHLGDVVEEDGNVVGDAVNLASRVESFAVPGSVLVSDVTADAVANHADLSFLALGRFRFKNVGRPFSLHAVDAPGLVRPDRTELEGKGEALRAFPASLPRHPVGFVGRDEEVEAVSSLLQTRRLVTITGPGGTGKTTLAVAIAHAVEDHFDAAAFVPLAAVSRADDLLDTVADALDVKEAEGREALEAIAARIGDGRVLLVLDNLEQVADAGGRLAPLLDRCSALHLLATSRGPLHVRDESTFPLLPLPVPKDPSDVLTSHAMELLASAAQRTNPGFAVSDATRDALVAICQRLDGLPLALELAAGRFRLLPPERVATRLDDALSLLTGGPRDADLRHQALSATIAWSNDLLDEPQKDLFRQLAVFPGEAPLDGVEAVAGPHALDDLGTLVDVGLVQANGGRFSLLGTIRQFALRALEDSGQEQEVRRRHAAYVAAAVRGISKDIEGGDQVAGIERGMALDADIAEVLERSSESKDDVDAGLAIAGDLWMYWHLRGKHLTTKRFTERLLARSAEPTPGRCGALLALGLAEWSLGRMADAGRTWEQAFELAESLGSTPLAARAAFCVGVAHLDDPALAVAWTTKGREIAEGDGDKWATAFARGFEALATALAGDLEGARDGFRSALEVQEVIGDHEGAGFSLGGLAFLASATGDDASAITLYARAVTEYALIDDRAEVARVLGESAWVLLRSGDVDAARTTFLEAAKAYGDVASVRGMATSLAGLAAAAASASEHERAVAIAAAAEQLSGAEGIVNVYADAPQGEELIGEARSALGERAAALDARGRAMTAEEALAFALDEGAWSGSEVGL